MLSDSFIHLYKYPRVSYKIHSEQLNQCFQTFCYHLQRSNSWFGSFPTFQISDMSELHPHAALRFSISTKYFQEISSRKCVFFQHSNANIRNLPIIASMSTNTFGKESPKVNKYILQINTELLPRRLLFIARVKEVSKYDVFPSFLSHL